MRLLLVLLIVPTFALAQQTSSGSTAAPQFNGHSCITYYPRYAVREHHEGKATIAFEITAQGTVKNVTVKSSSGYSELDNASVQCVQQWTYNPGTTGTQPFVQREAAIEWRLGRPSIDIGQVLAGAANACTQKGQIDNSAIAQATRPTVAEVQFYKDEAPAVVVDQSSGSDALDELFAHCLAIVPPNIHMNPPVKMSFKVTFSWKPDSGAGASPAPPGSDVAGTAPAKQ